MQIQILSQMDKPSDPREQDVAVRVYPFGPRPVTVTPVYDPARVVDAGRDASVHLARQAQQREREQAIAANLEAAADDLRMTQLLDSQYAAKVADALPADMPRDDRRQAAAVAVRLSDPMWQTVSRYRAAQAALQTLRTFLVANGLAGTVTESELRKAADTLAGVTQVARMRTWDGTDAVSAREWSRGKLGILNVQEER